MNYDRGMKPKFPLHWLFFSIAIGALASVGMALMAKFGALRAGVDLPLAPIVAGGSLGGLLGQLAGRWADRKKDPGTAGFLRVFTFVAAVSVATSVLGIGFLKDRLFPGVPVQFAVLALLGWGIGAFAGGIQVAIEVLIRPDSRSSS